MLSLKINSIYQKKKKNLYLDMGVKHYLFYKQGYRWELKIYFYYIILKFYLYLNLGCRDILKLKKNPVQTGAVP